MTRFVISIAGASRRLRRSSAQQAADRFQPGHRNGLRDMTLLRDTRGVAAVEFGIIASAMIGLLLPITDIGVAAMRYSSAYQALRSRGRLCAVQPAAQPYRSIETQSNAARRPRQYRGNSLWRHVIVPRGLSCRRSIIAPSIVCIFNQVQTQPHIFDVGCKEGCNPDISRTVSVGAIMPSFAIIVVAPSRSFSH